MMTTARRHQHGHHTKRGDHPPLARPRIRHARIRPETSNAQVTALHERTLITDLPVGHHLPPMLLRGQQGRSGMKSATRMLAAIATGGVMAGGGVALAQVSPPKTATTAAVTASTGSASSDAIQQLADQSAQLHAAVAAAQAQLTRLQPGSASATPTPPDAAALLAQTQAQLAAAQRRLAADEALLAKLQSGTHAPVPAPARNDPPPSASTPVATPEQQRATTTPSPPVRRTYSESPRPTNGAGDD
jgi:hypothetical protein